MKHLYTGNIQGRQQLQSDILRERQKNEREKYAKTNMRIIKLGERIFTTPRAGRSKLKTGTKD